MCIRDRAINAQMLGPIGEISETARALNAQNMSQRINVEGTRSELRELALVINEMLDRIEAAYDGQKQFVSDASHELRTPIAVIQGYATMLQRWGKDDAAVRDEAITAISSEAANMKDLVEKLLFLARHDRQTLKMCIRDRSSGVVLLSRRQRFLYAERTAGQGTVRVYGAAH